MAALVILGASTSVFALDSKSPAEIMASITGKSVETLSQERENGKTNGTLAKEAGELDEFKVQILEKKKERSLLPLVSSS